MTLRFLEPFLDLIATESPPDGLQLKEYENIKQNGHPGGPEQARVGELTIN